jgi:hypothetical protein
LRKVLAHAQKETKMLKVGALIFIGDALEEQEDELIPEARELGRLGVPAFMFQEGENHKVERVFREIARVTPRRLLPLRPRRGASTGRAPARGRGLCHRWGGCARCQ